jgi:hypothetical protein
MNGWAGWTYLRSGAGSLSLTGFLAAVRRQTLNVDMTGLLSIVFIRCCAFSFYRSV